MQVNLACLSSLASHSPYRLASSVGRGWGHLTLQAPNWVLPPSDTAIFPGPDFLQDITGGQGRQPLPLPPGYPGWQKSLSTVGGQGCVYFAINKEQRNWPGAGGAAQGLLLETRISALPLVLLTAGLGVARGMSMPSTIS